MVSPVTSSLAWWQLTTTTTGKTKDRQFDNFVVIAGTISCHCEKVVKLASFCFQWCAAGDDKFGIMTIHQDNQNGAWIQPIPTESLRFRFSYTQMEHEFHAWSPQNGRHFADEQRSQDWYLLHFDPTPSRLSQRYLSEYILLSAMALPGHNELIHLVWGICKIHHLFQFDLFIPQRTSSKHMHPTSLSFLIIGSFCFQMQRSNKSFNTLRPRQDGRHFPENIFKRISLNENVWILTKISLKFDPKGPINNIPTLVQIMAWRRTGDNALSDPMVVYWRIYVSLEPGELIGQICQYHGYWWLGSLLRQGISSHGIGVLCIAKKGQTNTFQTTFEWRSFF